MGLFGSSASRFPWISLTSEEQLRNLIEHSDKRPVLFFKHSTRCGISAMTISRFEREAVSLPEVCDCVYLDLLAYRQLSNLIEELTTVYHQSPQAILVKDKQVVYDASHNSISARTIESLI